MKFAFSVMAEIYAGEFFKDESINWRYCKKHATFKNPGACEFILHIGSGAGSESGARDRASV